MEFAVIAGAARSNVLEKGRVMKVRPQMVVGLVLAGCVAVTGVHFATAQQEQGGADQKAQPGAQQQDQGAQQQQQGAQEGAQQKQGQGKQGRREGIQRPDRGEKRGAREDRTRTRSRERTTVRSSSSSQFLRSSLILSAPVTLSGGASLGTVQEFVISDSGCIDYVIVSHDNRLVPVPWSVASFQAEDRVIMLDIEEAQLAQVPVITDFAELQNTEFVTKVNTFYKVDERSRERTGSKRDDRSGKSRRDDKAGKGDRGSDQNTDGQNRDAQKKSDSRPAPKNRGADTQKSDTQKSDAPKSDAPKADAPKSDAPKAAPKADAPKSETKKSDEKAPENPPKQ
jgi:hypothetical protein